MDKCIEQLEKDARQLLAEYDEAMKTSSAKIKEYKDKQKKHIYREIKIYDPSGKEYCENPNEPSISKEDTDAAQIDEIS